MSNSVGDPSGLGVRGSVERDAEKVGVRNENENGNA